MFTAPHSKRVMRGGEDFGEERRVHLNEIHAASIALKLSAYAADIMGAEQSSIVWNRRSPFSEEV